MPIGAEWRTDVQGFFAADQDWLKGRFYLVVERLPKRGWDWVVWASPLQGHCLHGVADTAAEAKVAAACALRLMQGARGTVLVRSDLSLYQRQESLN
jgi:hypothetical protein